MISIWQAPHSWKSFNVLKTIYDKNYGYLDVKTMKGQSKVSATI